MLGTIVELRSLKMKVFTFNAPEDTRVEVLWALRPKNKDRMFARLITEIELLEVDSIQDCQLAIFPYKAFNPETLILDEAVYNAAFEAKKYGKKLIIDATSDSNVFLDIPTANILRCGLYKSLQRSFEIECPFWSNFRTKQSLDSLTINDKGSRPKIGFCGTISSIGKVSQVTKHILPKAIAKSVLAEGKLCRNLDIRLQEGMSLKLRTTAIALLSTDKRIESYFDINSPSRSYYHKNINNKIELENLFVNNISHCDYTLCVRGTGNYSGRFYMALNAGRIPVVVDTDVVIPFDEKLHLVKVPAKSIEKIGDYVLEHFETTSESELKAMKQANRDVFHQFIAPERFFPNLLRDILKGEP